MTKHGRVALAFLMLAGAGSAAAVDGPAPHRASRGEPHRLLFQDAMRRRDLGYWQEALILFDEAGKRKAAEGERIKMYGRRRFPHYLPRFYVAEALFKLGDYSQAFAIWEEYAPDGQPAEGLPPAERRLLARYRAEYATHLREAVDTIKGQIEAARADLQSFGVLTKDFSPERWRELEARLRPGSCLRDARRTVTERAEVSGPRQLQELGSCLDQADALLQGARGEREYAGVKQARTLVGEVVARLFEWRVELQPGDVLRKIRPPDSPRGRPTSGRISATWKTSSARHHAMPLTLWDVRDSAVTKPALPHPMYKDRHALLIGVSDYKYWRKLPGVSADMDAVAAVLGELGFKVKRVPEPADRGALEKATRDFLETAGTDADNEILFYYAGHGQTVSVLGHNVGFITPKEAVAYDDRDNATFMKSAMSFDILFAAVGQMGARHAFFAFDSCFSGEVFEALGGTAARTAPPTRAGGGPGRGAKELGGGVDGAGDPEGELLQYYLSVPVRYILTAGTATQEVPDDGTFRRAFVAGLRGGVQVRRHAGLLTANELASFVHGEVTRVRGVRQIPVYDDMIHGVGQLFFPAPK